MGFVRLFPDFVICYLYGFFAVSAACTLGSLTHMETRSRLCFLENPTGLPSEKKATQSMPSLLGDSEVAHRPLEVRGNGDFTIGMASR